MTLTSLLKWAKAHSLSIEIAGDGFVEIEYPDENGDYQFLSHGTTLQKAFNDAVRKVNAFLRDGKMKGKSK